MRQERSECRRCRNRHCRQQKQTASKGHCKLFSVCQKKLRSKNGMTLTELLAAIVILGMIGTVLGGGVMMVKMFTRGRRIRQMQSRRCRSRRS